MRALRTISAGIAALALAAAAAGPVAAEPTSLHDNGNVRFSQIRYESSGKGLNGEYVKLTNGHTYPVDLRSWSLTETYSGHRYVFPDKWLAPGASVWLYSGRGRNGGANLYWNAAGYVWHNPGDLAVLRNGRSTRVDSCGWQGLGRGFTNCLN
ncbi:lamin tail domain-containing protein [Streptomyces sp. SL13]|jgi:hypothetical protein|uniref:Lamin tail domain-containing protein n=1 Tax=Streptantibioticus silvisoli TaxID=2705255 RepID=A0AA90H405_9ACTN|nr:lamin tail domain-containing protein [Streptantibioticus silvisoli]MDI5973698.1 lamin tail domain-containing protein [Streptantibioticus silvisoli]